MQQLKILDAEPELVRGDTGDNMVIRKTQHITDEFLQGTAQSRFDSTNRPTGDWHKFASIPTCVVEKWRREGFDIMKHKYSAREIMRRLSAEDLGAFITTSKVL